MITRGNIKFTLDCSQVIPARPQVKVSYTQSTSFSFEERKGAGGGVSRAGLAELTTGGPHYS